MRSSSGTTAPASAQEASGQTPGRWRGVTRLAAELRDGLVDLPASARRLVLGIVAAAVASTAAAVAVNPSGVRWQAVVGVAAAIAVGELFAMEVDSRRGSSVRFALGETALFLSLVLTAPGNVAMGAAVALFVVQLRPRAPAVKLLFNCAQYVVGAAAAALAWNLIAQQPVVPGPNTVVAFIAAAAAFTLVNNTLTAGIVGLTTGRAPLRILVRLTSMSAVMAVSHAALALLVIVLLEHAPWALLTMIAPLLILRLGSRAVMGAQAQRSRADTLVAVERDLGQARDAVAVAEQVVAGTAATVTMAAAVYQHGRWLAGAPDGSGPCTVPVDGDNVSGSARDFGIAADAEAVAVPFDSGVLVAWDAQGDAIGDLHAWLERIARAAGVYLDRAASAEALETERATLRTVVDGTADGIVVLDDEGVVSVWNGAMTLLAGGDGVGLPVADALGDGPWFEPGVHDVVRPPRRDACGEPSDDPDIWRVAVAVVDAPGRGKLHVAVVHDVTEERRLARAKDDMLAVVSHELRTPLTPLKAGAQMLARRFERMTPQQRTQIAEQLDASADHLARLVEDLILVAQLSASGENRPRVAPAAGDVAEIAGNAVDGCRENHPGHTFTVEGLTELPAVTDPVRLRQIISNLLDNAAKYSPAGSAVAVRVAAEPVRGDAVVDVVDAGPGIAADDRDRIFERFERLDDPLRMRTSGIGLGLYIVRELAEALGGGVTVADSGPGGTTMRVRVPIRAPALTDTGTQTDLEAGLVAVPSARSGR